MDVSLCPSGTCWLLSSSMRTAMVGEGRGLIAGSDPHLCGVLEEPDLVFHVPFIPVPGVPSQCEEQQPLHLAWLLTVLRIIIIYSLPIKNCVRLDSEVTLRTVHIYRKITLSTMGRCNFYLGI